MWWFKQEKILQLLKPGYIQNFNRLHLLSVTFDLLVIYGRYKGDINFLNKSSQFGLYTKPVEPLLKFLLTVEKSKSISKKNSICKRTSEKWNSQGRDECQ